MTPDEIRERGPAAGRASCRCRMSSRRPAARSFPNKQIDEIEQQEGRDLRRFDVDFDLPDHFTPEFPPPIFLTTHPELGDVSQRQAADDQELLRADGRHRHAGADGRPAAAADALPAGGVQSDRGPQGRRAEPRRGLPRLPRELPHQRGVPPDARRAPAGGALPARYASACAACSTSRSTARSGRCVRSRTSPSSSSAPPTSTATTSARSARACTCPTAPTRWR